MAMFRESDTQLEKVRRKRHLAKDAKNRKKNVN